MPPDPGFPVRLGSQIQREVTRLLFLFAVEAESAGGV